MLNEILKQIEPILIDALATVIIAVAVPLALKALALLNIHLDNGRQVQLQNYVEKGVSRAEQKLKEGIIEPEDRKLDAMWFVAKQFGLTPTTLSEKLSTKTVDLIEARVGHLNTIRAVPQNLDVGQGILSPPPK